MIQPERIEPLNSESTRSGDYILYWMQASQRMAYNHALAYAIEQANRLGRPLVVGFGLTADYLGATARHYTFMLEGLRELAGTLKDRGMELVVRLGPPPSVIADLAQAACLVVVDRGYLRLQKRWRQEAARRLGCPLIQVESDCIVPVETASPKEDYAAATLRPKIHRLLPRFLVPMRMPRLKKDSLGLALGGLDLEDVPALVRSLKVDESVGPVAGFAGGESQAQKRLRQFIKTKLDDYDAARNDPTLDGQSDLSPYLHFGQISPLEVALEVQKTASPGQEAFLEELIVRRELSLNFVYYNPHYDTFKSLPAWAARTLRFHQKDKRAYQYSLAELRQAQTHDPYWNAAQREMMLTGKMHGYMRMYWGKKILEWSRSPAQAWQIAVTLNDTYELDGRDPNGYAGIAWCFGKHDRPWARRPIFGQVRYMNDAGLRRKFDIEGYVRAIPQLPKA